MFRSVLFCWVFTYTLLVHTLVTVLQTEYVCHRIEWLWKVMYVSDNTNESTCNCSHTTIINYITLSKEEAYLTMDTLSQ